MKKNLFIALALIVLLASIAWAASINVKTFGNDPSYTEKFALLSSATNTTTGSVYKLGKPFKDISCVMSNPSGSVPAVVVFNVAGGLDDTNLVTLATVSASTWPQLITTNTTTASNVMYVRSAITSWTTNTGSPLRLECVAAHN